MDKKIVGVRFDEERLTYCTFSDEVEVGDLVIVNLEGFPFSGTVEKIRFPREDENLEIYNSIIRVATFEDKDSYNESLKKDLKLVGEIQKEADLLKLNMTVFRATSSIDGSKIKIMYTSEDRVDFRNLLKVLASKLHARLELRQVGPRDRAKMVGGIGICGRPLCCSSFLNSFDIISISMAKNQMLSINIPKLSGQCGKLICCLKYENETYTQEKQGFPKFGEMVKYDSRDMKIIGMNVLNKKITIADRESRITITLDEYNKLINKEDKVQKPSFDYKPINSNSFNSNQSANTSNDNSTDTNNGDNKRRSRNSSRDNTKNNEKK